MCVCVCGCSVCASVCVRTRVCVMLGHRSTNVCLSPTVSPDPRLCRCLHTLVLVWPRRVMRDPTMTTTRQTLTARAKSKSCVGFRKSNVLVQPLPRRGEPPWAAALRQECAHNTSAHHAIMHEPLPAPQQELAVRTDGLRGT